MKKVLTSAVCLVVIVVSVSFLRSFFNVPMDKKDGQQIQVTVPAKSGVSAIAGILKESGLIRNKTGFIFKAFVSGAQAKLKAGNYYFSKAESGKEILERLENGDIVSNEVDVTFPEGFTEKQIAARLEETGLGTTQQFLDRAKVQNFRDEFAFLKNVPDGSLEGYLFPDTYRFFKNASTDEIIRKMLSHFDEKFQTAVSESAPLGDKKLHEVVTMASIIEREVQTKDDMKMVAGVLWNRLDIGMALQADATVRYALNNWDNPLTVQDLAVDSPYNTRLHGGLPPGPIGNPGSESLKAALQPKDSDYLYYLSSAPGKETIFSKTLDEHNRAIQKYLR